MVPKDARKDVLLENHDCPLAAHGGYHKTLSRVRKYYYWPQMSMDIKRHVVACKICNASKPSSMNQTAPMGNFREVDRPWRMISIDFIGPLPRSLSGFCHLLVVVDNFSKFIHLHPMRRITAKATVKFLKERIFLQFGCPEILISDNGGQLVSREFKKFLEDFSVKHWLTSSYHPQANSTEAANKTIGIAIRSYILNSTEHRRWDEFLSEIACAMNTAVHGSTKFSPYHVNFGQKMTTSGNSYSMEHGVVKNREESFGKIRELVQENLRSAYETNKKRYDLRARPVVYQKGDIVWKRNFVLSDASKNISAKLSPLYTQCKVREKVGTSSYLLEDLKESASEYLVQSN